MSDLRSNGVLAFSPGFGETTMVNPKKPDSGLYGGGLARAHATYSCFFLNQEARNQCANLGIYPCCFRQLFSFLIAPASSADKGT